MRCSGQARACQEAPVSSEVWVQIPLLPPHKGEEEKPGDQRAHQRYWQAYALPGGVGRGKLSEIIQIINQAGKQADLVASCCPCIYKFSTYLKMIKNVY